jgi:DegV family protein with EDD domain
MSYRIFTDSCCDFPQELLAQLNITVTPLTLMFRNQVWQDTTDAGLKAIYDGLRAGETASTAAANPEDWCMALEPALAMGEDALILAFSSGLSTTYQSANIAAQELSEKYPQRTIRVVDTLCASLGQGLLVWYACRNRDAGMSLEELAQWCEENKWKLCHWFTVDDLMYLKRGGRVSAATAVLGTMLNIKPVLHVDNAGHLVKVGTARGRKASIEALANKLSATGLPGENDTVFISHGDCREDAEFLAKLLQEKCGVKEVVIGYVGAVIGSHAGPGVLALFFLGNAR